MTTGLSVGPRRWPMWTSDHKSSPLHSKNVKAEAWHIQIQPLAQHLLQRIAIASGTVSPKDVTKFNVTPVVETDACQFEFDIALPFGLTEIDDHDPHLAI